MRKLIAVMNITIDGFCDHTVMNADAELHQHYTDLLNRAGSIIYGRVTYQMMESYWPSVIKNPTEDNASNDFALAIDNIQKIVFSRTVKDVSWKNSILKKEVSKEEVSRFQMQSGKDILVGSPSLILGLTQLNVIDEYQLCIHPVIAGGGLSLFKNIQEKRELKLLNTKAFGSGAIVHRYEPTKQ